VARMYMPKKAMPIKATKEEIKKHVKLAFPNGAVYGTIVRVVQETVDGEVKNTFIETCLDEMAKETPKKKPKKEK